MKNTNPEYILRNYYQLPKDFDPNKTRKPLPKRNEALVKKEETPQQNITLANQDESIYTQRKLNSLSKIILEETRSKKEARNFVPIGNDFYIEREARDWNPIEANNALVQGVISLAKLNLNGSNKMQDDEKSTLNLFLNGMDNVTFLETFRKALNNEELGKALEDQLVNLIRKATMQTNQEIDMSEINKLDSILHQSH